MDPKRVDRCGVLANIQTFWYNDSAFFWKLYYQLIFLVSFVVVIWVVQTLTQTLTRLQGAIDVQGPAQKFAGL